MHVFLLAVLIEAASCDSHARTNQQPHRSTIVHLFEWKWKDIAEECETFLGPKGFGAVQVSPPSENLIMHLKHLKNSRPWYERYQPMSYKINTRSGNEEEFVDMTRRCNKAGVRFAIAIILSAKSGSSAEALAVQKLSITVSEAGSRRIIVILCSRHRYQKQIKTIYADVVLNHMAGDYNTNIGTAGSTADFEKYQYPAVPYNREHFHEPCTINFNIAKQVRECQLDGTKDLNHKNEHVQERIVDYLNKLIDMGVAGFRIDAAKHIWPEDLRKIFSQLHHFEDEHLSRSKPYLYHEVAFNATGEAVKPFEYTEFGDVADYRVGEELKNLFRGYNALKLLYNWGPDWGLLPSDNALVSIDNHESQRKDDVLTYKEAKAYKAAIAFILAHPYGEPRVMSSYYFHKWEQGPPSDNDGNILSPNVAGCNQSQKSETHGNGWVCEHRWRQIYQMVAFRNTVRGSDVVHWWDNGNNLIAFSRGDKGFIAFNLEDGKDMNATVKVALPPGEYCDVISGERNYGQCTGRKVIVTEQREGWRVADISIPTHAEDSHIAIHVGSESSLQTDWIPSDTIISERPPMEDGETLDQQAVDQQTIDRRTVDDGQSWQTTRSHLWHKERDPLPPLTSELPRTETCEKQHEESGSVGRKTGQVRVAPRIVQSGHRRPRERDPLPPLTSAPESIEVWIKQMKKDRHTSQDYIWHRERDPLPPLSSESASTVTWINQENEGRQPSYQWLQERDSILPSTAEPANIPWKNRKIKTGKVVTIGIKNVTRFNISFLNRQASKKLEKKNWLTGHRRLDQEREPLPPLMPEPEGILAWKK